MRRPSERGTPRDSRRYRRWLRKFGSYRGVTSETVESWIRQFNAADHDLAARVLDVVEYFGQEQIREAYRQALNALPGWHISKNRRKGRWAFAAMSTSAGESGDSMLYEFRLANGLSSRDYKGLFLSRSELLRQRPEGDPERLGPDDVVVLLDDFSGTGNQICDAWNDPELSFGALLEGVGTVYLVVVAASQHARTRIQTETALQVSAAHILADGDNIFSTRCGHFTARERERLLHYGRIADNSSPKGYGDCGFVVAFQHRIPNNSIPILHRDHRRWTALFARHD